jgi:transposase-like protein
MKTNNGRTRKLKLQKRPQDWTAEQKYQVVLDAAGLSEEELGAFLRRKGLHQVQLEQWRSRATEGAMEALSRKHSSRKNTAEARRIRNLERELRRKEKALAETAALLVLKKKAAAIWGDGDDFTGPRTER